MHFSAFHESVRNSESFDYAMDIQSPSSCPKDRWEKRSYRSPSHRSRLPKLHQRMRNGSIQLSLQIASRHVCLGRRLCSQPCLQKADLINKSGILSCAHSQQARKFTPPAMSCPITQFSQSLAHQRFRLERLQNWKNAMLCNFFHFSLRFLLLLLEWRRVLRTLSNSMSTIIWRKYFLQM